MMQEDKELLLTELCARLAYGVICSTPEGDGHLCSINQTMFGNEYGINIKATKRSYFSDRECEIRPYLRRLSSMTEGEMKEYYHLVAFSGNPIGSANFANWLNVHHIDYRGLIDMGLAVEVTEENNPYKE